MYEQANVETTLAKLADHRIQKKRHVVVDDVEYRDTGRCVRRDQPQLRLSRRALGEEPPSVVSDRREFLGAVALKILRQRLAEKALKKILGNARPAQRQRCGCRSQN